MSESTREKAARLQREAAEAAATADQEEQARIDAAIDAAAQSLARESNMTLEQAQSAIRGRFEGTGATGGTESATPPPGTSTETPAETSTETVPPVPPVTEPETPPAETPPAETPPAETPEAPSAPPPPAEVAPQASHWSQRKIGLPRRKEKV